MARKTWQTPNGLEKILVRAKDYHFFQLLRLFEMFYVEEAVLDFKSVNTVSFSHQIIEKIELSAENHLTIYINIFNLFGANAVMPAHYTVLLKKAIAEKDHVLHDFIDIFLNRLINYLYQAWLSGRQIIADQQVGLETLLTSLLGGNQTISADKTLVHAKLYYVSLFAKKTKSSIALANLLMNFFSMKIEIENFLGKKVTIDRSVCSRLSHQATYNQLAINCNLGNIYWETQRFFKVIIGSINYQQLMTILPSTEKLFLMQKLIRDYVGDEYGFDLMIKLDQTVMPVVKLTQEKPLYQLGWNSWLSAKQQEQLERNITIYQMPRCVS